MTLAKKIALEGYEPTEDEVQRLLDQFSLLCRSLPNVVRVDSTDLIIVGDLHGEVTCLNTIIRRHMTPESHLIFLGDYGDRGPHQVETVNRVLALKLAYPDRITVLRGNHESEDIAKQYGFYTAVSSKYSHDAFDRYSYAFSILPMAAISSNGDFFCHGGVPEGLDSLAQLQSLDRYSKVIKNPIFFQLTWNDPREGSFRFRPNMRGGGSCYFGKIAFKEFCQNMGVRRFFRAHEAFPDGSRAFFDGNLFSVFSSSYGDRVRPCILHLIGDTVHQIALS